MTDKSNQFYDLQFFENYVIIKAKEDAVINKNAAEDTLKLIHQHFDSKPFSIISHRVNNYTLLLESYNTKYLNKVEGIAIVSENPEQKQNAILEQQKFNRSFAFFEKIEEAKQWAGNVSAI